jgi:flagellar secretion chaperone FliS
MEPEKMNAYMNQYQKNQVSTASSEQILIMLYDGAIRFVHQADEAMASGKKVQKLESISKAMAIITELANTLDHEVGGEIAENLDALYSYMTRELTRANLKNDRELLKVVETLLSDLRETWMQAIEINRKSKAETSKAAVSDQSASSAGYNSLAAAY